MSISRNRSAIIRVGVMDNDSCALKMISTIVEHATPLFMVAWSTVNTQHMLEHCLFDAPDKKANVILLDMGLNGVSGVELCRRIRMRDGNTGILGITAYPATYYLAECVDAGAQGLMEKTDLLKTQLLVDSITRAAQGLPCNPLSDFQTAYESHIHLSCSTHNGELTPQELTVLRLYADHNSTASIAKQLHIATGTVFSHVHHAVQKLGVRNRNEAIRACKAAHLI